MLAWGLFCVFRMMEVGTELRCCHRRRATETLCACASRVWPLLPGTPTWYFTLHWRRGPGTRTCTRSLWLLEQATHICSLPLVQSVFSPARTHRFAPSSRWCCFPALPLPILLLIGDSHPLSIFLLAVFASASRSELQNRWSACPHYHISPLLHTPTSRVVPLIYFSSTLAVRNSTSLFCKHQAGKFQPTNLICFVWSVALAVNDAALSSHPSIVGSDAMDHDAMSRHLAARQPLGDATQRLNHATVSNVSRKHEPGGVENDVLARPKNAAPRGRSDPVITAHHPSPIGQHRGHHPPAPVSPATAAIAEPGPANPRLTAIAQDHHNASDARRVSQFSNVSSNASTTRQLKTHIGPWQLGKTLGKGSSARVRLARHRVSHQLVAIKIVAKSTAHMTQAGSLANLDKIDYRKPTTGADGGLRRMPLAIEREVAILKLIRHPNIIELLDIWENRSEM